MRFNDLLRTVLGNSGEGAGAAVTRWRQCMDLLAQYDVSGSGKPSISPEEKEAILAIMEGARPQISLERRIASVIELGPRLRSPTLVRFLSRDHPSLVVAMMKSVALSGEDWVSVIPEIGPLARSVLRRRPGLDPMALSALKRFGEIDLSLPASLPMVAEATEYQQAPADSPSINVHEAAPHADREADQGSSEEPSQIGRIVARIERFKKSHPFQQADVAKPASEWADESVQSAPPVEESLDHFQFETDASGLVRVADGARPAAVIGLSIATPGLGGSHGVDGATLGAFRHRAAFEGNRLVLNDGPLAGEWRISGEPHFDRQSGRFLGYTGTARRERRFEGPVRPKSAEQVDERGNVSASDTRQLIHELRTPLNAVHGYGEMIEAQILGPVPDAYREIARSILADARSLLSTFDDLDTASRLERGDAPSHGSEVDLGDVLRSVLVGLDCDRDDRVSLSVESGLCIVEGDRGQIERMLSHLIRVGRAGLADDEQLVLCLCSDPAGGSVSLTMSRPAALRGITDRELMEQGYVVEQQLRGPALPLGIPFTLRLIRGIVRHLGGEFAMTPQAFGIVLPTAPETQQGQEHNA